MERRQRLMESMLEKQRAFASKHLADADQLGMSSYTGPESQGFQLMGKEVRAVSHYRGVGQWLIVLPGVMLSGLRNEDWL